jgi:hypothetical protein
MTIGGIFSLGAVSNWLVLCSDVPESQLSGLGADGKAVLIAASVTVGFRLDLVCFFLEVMTMKPSSSAISLKFGG